MIISESAIQMHSERTAVEKHKRSESLNLGKTKEEFPTQYRRRREDSVTILPNSFGKTRQTVKLTGQEVDKEQRMEADLNIKLLRQLFERITGRKFRIIDPMDHPTVQQPDIEKNITTAEPGQPSAPTEEGGGFDLSYNYHESHYEYEKTDFKASGTIRTGDGEKIDFNLTLSMSREFYSEQNLQFSAGNVLKDPLVVNFSGTSAQLSQRDFHFDIDADGHADQIAFVAPGSGFLALDKNNDGIINDGRELFGAISGDGFNDLREYDSDGNNWIDENDTVYDNLRIWSRNSAGEEKLVALGKAGIGAIYLEHIETLFSIKDENNEQLGQVRESSLAIMESGQAISVQQLDLVA